ncbi:MAG: hypothetical protein JWM99_3246 [Verrucomicrobiales bacterium]|jgi:hypothetical protein|nr:hypothetical protein [Verrucomicrobiales bacterium]
MFNRPGSGKSRTRWLLLTIVFGLLCLNSWACFSLVGYERSLSDLLEGPRLPPLLLLFLRWHFIFFMLSLVFAALSFAILMTESLQRYRKLVGFLLIAMIAQAFILYALIFMRVLLVLRAGSG